MKNTIKFLSLLLVVLVANVSANAGSAREYSNKDLPKVKADIQTELLTVAVPGFTAAVASNSLFESNVKYTPNQMASIVGLWENDSVEAIKIEEADVKAYFTPEQYISILDIKF